MSTIVLGFCFDDFVIFNLLMCFFLFWGHSFFGDGWQKKRVRMKQEKKK